MKKISICIVCYNEELNIEDCYSEVTKVMQKLDGYDYEIIFADNDSEDSSQDILRGIVKKDKHVKAIFNTRNFGPDRSGKNCMSSASGDAVIGIPCDLQEPPEMIPEFVKYWSEGWPIVWGQKVNSKENFLKFFFRKIYYKIIKKFSDAPKYEQVSGFGIMDKSVLNLLLSCEEDAFFHHLVPELGIKVKLIPYTQNERKKGKSSYNISRYFDFALLSLIKTSKKPLKISVTFGLFCSVISFICGVIYFIYKLLRWKSFSVGIAPILIAVFFIGSVQLFFIGIIGEYIGVILDRLTKRPLVVEKERLGFDEEERK